MKKRILILLVLMTLALVLRGSVPAPADSPPEITGLGLPVPQGGDGLVWTHFKGQQIDPQTEEATGWCRWVTDPITHKVMGWCRWEKTSQQGGVHYLDARPTSVTFTRDLDGKAIAVFVAEIVSSGGWDWGELEEYTSFWVRDGDTPSGEGDMLWNSGLPTSIETIHQATET